MFKTPEGECPRAGTPKLPAGEHSTVLTVPEGAKDKYQNAKDGAITLTYDAIQGGDAYCTTEDASEESLVTFGGTVLFKVGDACMLPPVGEDGDPCCTLYTWQPNSNGFYSDNCSMKCASLSLVSAQQSRMRLAGAMRPVAAFSSAFYHTKASKASLLQAGHQRRWAVLVQDGNAWGRDRRWLGQGS
jgi:hypothetical protein